MQPMGGEDRVRLMERLSFAIRQVKEGAHLLRCYEDRIYFLGTAGRALGHGGIRAFGAAAP